MSKITPEILKVIAPRTIKAKRDRFLPDLNKLLPHYQISNELRVSAFLATCCIESDYWKATAEYGKGKGKVYARIYKDTGKAYYGRGIIQNTWRKAYEDFTGYVSRNWSWLQPMSGIKDAPDFVTDPDLLTEPFWAVLGACWFWHRNKLNIRADGGVKNFFAIQGIVNRGNPAKKALHYTDRLAIYETLRRVIPDDFTLILNKPSSTDESSSPRGSSANALPSADAVDKPKPDLEGWTPDDSVSAQNDSGGKSVSSAPETDLQNNESASSAAATETTQKATVETGNATVESETTRLNEQSVYVPAEVTEPPPQGFMKKLAAGVATIFGGTIIYDAAGKLSGIQFSMQTIYVICFVIFLAFLGFCVWAVLDAIKNNARVRAEMESKTSINRKDIIWVKPESG